MYYWIRNDKELYDKVMCVMHRGKKKYLFKLLLVVYDTISHNYKYLADRMLWH